MEGCHKISLDLFNLRIELRSANKIFFLALFCKNIPKIITINTIETIIPTILDK